MRKEIRPIPTARTNFEIERAYNWKSNSKFDIDKEFLNHLYLIGDKATDDLIEYSLLVLSGVYEKTKSKNVDTDREECIMESIPQYLKKIRRFDPFKCAIYTYLYQSAHYALLTTYGKLYGKERLDTNQLDITLYEELEYKDSSEKIKDICEEWNITIDEAEDMLNKRD